MGILVPVTDGATRRYYGCLVTFLGDTPASSLVGGSKEGVGGAYRCCRTCMIKSDDLSTIVSYLFTPVEYVCNSVGLLYVV